MLELDREVGEIVEREAAMQASVLRMIPSENIVSDSVLEALGSIFTNRYAEGYPSKRYYQGQENNDALERLTCARACELFGAEHANVQSYSGSPANMAAYMAICQPGDRTVGLGLNSGGHLTHGWKVNFSGQLYEAHQIEVRQDTERIDYDEVAKYCDEVKPKVLFIGTTSYSRAFDFARLREIADGCGAYLVADIAHVAGLVVAGVYPNPVPYADIVTLTTHKTLRGPRGGLVLCKEKWAKALDKAVFPGMQGGPLENIIAAKAVCFREWMQPEMKDYAAQIVKNCKAMCKAVQDRGFRIVSGGTDNHLFLVDVKASGLTGKEAAAALDNAGIVVNKNAIPYDTESPFVTSGIRVGTASISTRGMKEAEAALIGGWIADILSDISNTALQAEIKAKAKELTAKFPVP